MDQNQTSVEAILDRALMREYMSHIGCNIEYGLEMYNLRRKQKFTAFLRENELELDKLGFRLYDAKHFASRVPEIDVEKYIKDATYHAEQQEALRPLLNPEEAEELYRMAREEFNNHEYEAMVRHIIRAAMLGHPAAQVNMGEMCAKNGPMEACYWFWKAACGGSLKGMRLLAQAYREGKGVSKDWGQMLYLYCRAAMELEPDAVYGMGRALLDAEVFEGMEEQGKKVLAALENPEDEAAAREIPGIAADAMARLQEKMKVITLP